ncbi:hypothetical protein [Streptomyces lydicus]|uniref:hypothetical protein n=1 Tax=Streptomyces lydicus TaxID=47763 RepID=UPI0033182447
MSEVDDRLLDQIDSVANAEEPRLPLLTMREARAVVELLQLLAAPDAEGGPAARHLAGNLARRLPAAD